MRTSRGSPVTNTANVGKIANDISAYTCDCKQGVRSFRTMLGINMGNH